MWRDASRSVKLLQSKREASSSPSVLLSSRTNGSEHFSKIPVPNSPTFNFQLNKKHSGNAHL